MSLEVPHPRVDDDKQTQNLDRLKPWADELEGSLVPTGGMIAWPSDVIPSGWLLCNGQAVSRSTYAELFAVTGTAYGAGDGSTTFNLPDFRGRSPVGADGETGRLTYNWARGQAGGAEKHTLTVGEIPPHAHSLSGGGSSTGSGSILSQASSGGMPNTGSAGGGGAHNNMPPYQIVKWLIRAT